jgi:ribose transport system ATP-binding protein
MKSDYIIEMNGITKRFPGVLALDGVTIQIKPGEIRGLVGKNGAGKSTLIKILTGIYPKDEGQIIIENKEVDDMTTGVSKKLKISCIHQNSQMIPSLSIAENLFCGDLPKTKFGFVNWNAVFSNAENRLSNIGLDLDVKRNIDTLSVSERQMLEIAKSMFADSRIIILDEPTAPLPKNEVEMLFRFVRKQKEQGVTFIYISHYLEEIFEICDTVTILRNGKKVGDYKVEDINQDDLIHSISGEQFERLDRKSHATEEDILTIENLTLPGVYENINLQIKQGEIVGLTGLDGSGKATLAKGLFGLAPLGTGKVILDGKDYSINSTSKAFSLGLTYLPRDRQGFGIIGLRSVKENITIPIIHALASKLGIINSAKEKKHVSDLIDQLSIKTPNMSFPVKNLSGGNQQKVVFAKLVGSNPKVMLLDEPNQGVDIQAKVEIMRLIDKLSTEGVASIIISEEIHELLDVCDRIVVMYKGKIITQFIIGEERTTVENILHAIEGSLLK